MVCKSFNAPQDAHSLYTIVNEKCLAKKYMSTLQQSVDENDNMCEDTLCVYSDDEMEMHCPVNSEEENEPLLCCRDIVCCNSTVEKQ